MGDVQQDEAQRLLADIRSADRQVQGGAYEAVIAATDVRIDWAYEIWDEVIADLGHDDNRVRSIAAQLLCNLAKSDPQQRIVEDLPRLLAVTEDERFVTARHCLQSLWKLAVVGPVQREVYRDGLAQRFAGCRSEKNWSLIRSDIVQSLGDAYRHTGDETIRATAEALIDSEDDDRYRAKYAKVWKRATS